MAFPIGFHSGLADFAFFVYFAYCADACYKPPTFYRWIFFALFVLLSVLFFFAWLADLGAHF